MPITPTNPYGAAANALDRWSGYGLYGALAKGGKAVTKAYKKEAKYGPWPQIGRNYGAALKAWQTGEFGGKQMGGDAIGAALPGTQIYTPQWQEQYSQQGYSPMGMEVARRQMAQQNARWGRGPEGLAFGLPAIEEAKFRDISAAHRNAYLAATEGNYNNAVNALTTMGGEREREFGMRNTIESMRAAGQSMTEQMMMQQDAAQSGIRAQNQAMQTGALARMGAGAIGGGAMGAMGMLGPVGWAGGAILGATGAFGGF